MSFYSNLLGSAGVNQPSTTTYEISRSLRFNSSDSAYLGATFSTPTDQDVFTLSMWVKRSALGSTQHLFGVSTNHSFGFTSGDALNLTFGGSSALTTTALFRDPSAWYHIVWTQNGTSHTIYVNNASVGTATATSSVFNTAVAHQLGAGNTANFFNGYLAYIHFIDGQAKSPSSFGLTDENGIWQPAVYSGSYGTNGFHLAFADNSAATATALGKDTSGNGNNWTPNNLSVNESGITGLTGIGTNPSNMFDLNVNSASIGANNTSLTWNGTINLGTGSYYLILNAYGVENQGPGSASLTVNGAVYTSTYSQIRANTDILNKQIGSGGTFTSTFDGRRTNITPSGSGSLTQISASATGGGFANAFYAVVFIPSGVSQSDFANHVVISNLAGLNDSLVDTPTNYGTDTGAGGEVRGNYATLNPLATVSDTLSNGNLDWVSGLATNRITKNTIGMSSGKWYVEFLYTGTVSGTVVGICEISATGNGGAPTVGIVYYQNGQKIINGSATSYGASWASGDTIGIALDLDGNQITFYKNNTSQGAISVTSGLTWNFCCIGSSANDKGTWNFGQRPFAYTAPSGYKALCTANLDDPQTITTSGSYTGNGVADGPFVYLNGVPTAMTVNGNAVTFGTHADKLSNGFKIRTTSTTYNQNASTYNYSITSTGDLFKIARAQSNP